jgi:RNA polymerase sigma-70 factor (ECF subfamily)
MARRDPDEGSPATSSQLLDRWRRGDQQAAAQLWRRYAERLIALARSRLSRTLARRLDPEDLVQSAYRSFFAAARTDRYVLAHSGDLWRLLVAITLHKLEHQVRRHNTKKRSMKLESRLGEADSPLAIHAQVLTREPSPAEAASLTEELEQLMVRLTPQERQMVELCLQGYTLAEIAKAVGRHEATIRRHLEQVKRYLKRRCAGWAAGE